MAQQADGAERGRTRTSVGPPGLVAAVATGMVASVVLVLSAWLATRPGAEQAQTALARWFNEPPPPIDALFAVVNPFFRPLPLALVGTAILGWVILTARSRSDRLEIVRGLALAYAIAQLIAQGMKRVANQPRPLAVLPDLNTHGYPEDPIGYAYPSAHTASIVAIVVALWPWMRWPQRIVGIIFAILAALNRLYIGAHWPIDVVGGAAIGVLAGALVWLIAAQWPIRTGSPRVSTEPTL